MIPLVDLTRRALGCEQQFGEAVGRVLHSGTYLLGRETLALEVELAQHAAADSREVVAAVAVSSGASALQLSLLALGVGIGDEVIVPAFTAVPTAAAVCSVGAIPVFVDVDRRTACLDLQCVKSAITTRTKAVIVVHLYGYPAEIPDVGVPVIEDCAQAHGALRWPRPACSTAVCLSFYPTKNLGGIGDGGAVLSTDPHFAETIRRYRTHGLTTGYVHTDIAMNFRMSELEAAWLRIGLGRLDEANNRRRIIADRYRSATSETSVTPQESGVTWQALHGDHVYHLAVAHVDRRDDFGAHMASAGIATGCHYPVALVDQPAYRRFVTNACPTAAWWADGCVSLPCYPEMREDEIACVEQALANWK